MSVHGRRARRLGALAVLAALAGGCASVPSPGAPPADLFADEGFEASPAVLDPADIFALGDTTRQQLMELLRPLARSLGPRHALMTALFDRHALRIDYDASVTRTAEQTFQARAGNCLSLVILTAALARELDLGVSYQLVTNASSYARAGGLIAYSEHVNIVLGGAGSGRRQGHARGTLMTIDFLPAGDLAGQRTVPITEATVVAMFMNNRAVEALVAGRIDESYAWARAAIRSDPGFMPGFNTLALAMARRGLDAPAERALRHALAGEPGNPQFLANLIDRLAARGATDELPALRERLARIEPERPFQALEQGVAAMRSGRPAEARAHFERELRRDPDYHETHFWMAQAAWALGDAAAARNHLALAERNGQTRAQQALYAAKLDRLTAAHPR